MRENDTKHRQPPMPPMDEHNQKLVDFVHPADWKNPRPAERYHLVVIGGGTAGLVSAAGAAGLGARVALVERHWLGGDCLNVGCVPSKGVISAARAWHGSRRGKQEFGAPSVGGDGDFGFAMERMRRLRSNIGPEDGAERFRSLGVDVFFGEGRFVAGDAVEVGGERLRFKKALIAAGGRAAALPIPGLDKVEYLTNETIFSLTKVPLRLVVIGGGPIGCEMAQSFARFGSEVHLFDIADHVLPREDADAAAIVQESLVRDGVILHLGAKISEIRSGKGGTKVVVAEEGGTTGGSTTGGTTGEGAEKGGTTGGSTTGGSTTGGTTGEVSCDQLLVAVGRKPNTEGLGLEAAGVEYDRRGVEVDDRLRTTNPKIFAAGDIASKYQFTHAADAQARIVLRNAFFFGRQRASQLIIPWATYTSPEVAHVGLYAKEAEEQGFAVDTLTLPLDDVDRANLDGEAEGFLRIHLKKGSDKILGGTLVAAHAGDMIGTLALAMTHGIGLSKFSSTIFPYPTQGEIFRKAGDAYMRTKLTPLAKKLFDFWFKIVV